MSRFQFRFEALLRLRENERDAARQEISDAFRALDILEEQQFALEQQRQQLRVDSQQRIARPQFSVDTLLNQGRYDLQLQAEIQAIQKNCATVQREIERRQAKLQAADVEVKRLERLREKQLRDWSIAELAAQQKEFDELASMRFTRSQNNDGLNR